MAAEWSLPAWGVWIEIAEITGGTQKIGSLPAWGVWIEIAPRSLHLSGAAVTPRMGSVD